MFHVLYTLLYFRNGFRADRVPHPCEWVTHPSSSLLPYLVTVGGTEQMGRRGSDSTETGTDGDFERSALLYSYVILESPTFGQVCPSFFCRDLDLEYVFSVREIPGLSLSH